jgi:PXPV repeat (3 copies)
MKAWVFHALTKETLMKPYMKTFTRTDHRLMMAGFSAALALAAMSLAGTAHARDNVTFSVGIGVPGVVVGATNAYPVYTQPRPVYVQPQPVYVQPAPVYYQPAPVYYSAPPVYVQPQPVYYGRPAGWHGHRHGHRGYGERGDYRGNGYGPGYGQGYAPVYYQR